MGFASCTTLSVLCKSFQRTLFLSPSNHLQLVLFEVSFELESECKGMTFFDTSKTIQEKSDVFIMFLTCIHNNRPNLTNILRFYAEQYTKRGCKLTDLTVLGSHPDALRLV